MNNLDLNCYLYVTVFIHFECSLTCSSGDAKACHYWLWQISARLKNTCFCIFTFLSVINDKSAKLILAEKSCLKCSVINGPREICLTSHLVTKQVTWWRSESIGNETSPVGTSGLSSARIVRDISSIPSSRNDTLTFS